MNRIPDDQRGAEFYYLNLIVEEIEKSYPPGSCFTQESLQYVYRRFRAEYSVIFSDRCLKNKLKTAKKKYEKFSELLNEEGVYWDKKSNIVYGEEKLLQEKYRERIKYGYCLGEVNYDLMCQIFESGVKFPCLA